MRVFLGYVLEDEVGEFHSGLIDEIADTFHIPSLNDKFGPHITFKEAFEIEPALWAPLGESLSTFATQHTPTRVTLGHWEHFGRTVVFRAVDPSTDFISMHRELFEILHKQPVITFTEHDVVGSNYHLTVAKGITNIFTDVWHRVSQIKVERKLITVKAFTAFSYENFQWHTIKTYPFESK